MAVTVWPEPLPVSELPSLERFLSVSWQPKPGGGFSENHELRLYRPGDRLNQVHWKLSAKTGKTIVREPMEPTQRRMLVELVLSGTPEELDRKLGRLLWLGGHLLELELSFELRALTGEGEFLWPVASPETLQSAAGRLLRTPAAPLDAEMTCMAAAWRYRIGGGKDEA